MAWAGSFVEALGSCWCTSWTYHMVVSLDLNFKHFNSGYSGPDSADTLNPEISAVSFIEPLITSNY